MKKISVIIVTYNSENLIYDCLDSIFINNDIDGELEVIIVDNMSKNVDLMFSNIRDKYNGVKLIKNTKNGGYGQGNNLGIKASTAPIIMIMNPDVRLVNPIFNRTILHFLDQNVVMLGMRQMLSENKQGFSFSNNFHSYPIFNLLLNKISHKLQIYNQKRMFFSGAAFFIKKNVFEEIGLFDENIFMYGEENDVHYRLINYYKSSKFIYNKRLQYIHLVKNRPFSEQVYKQKLKSRLYFYKKYNIDYDTYFRNNIRLEKMWILIAKIRRNKSRQEMHNKMLIALSEYRFSKKEL